MLGLIQPTLSHMVSSQRVPKDSMSPIPDRPWIKARLSAGNEDVVQIMNKWTAQKIAAKKLATAIRLLDALDRGDLPAALEIHPPLGLMGSTSPKTKKRKVASPLLFDSDSLKQDQEEEKGGTVSVPQPTSPEIEDDPLAAMMTAIGKVTEIDVQVNQRRIKILARKLIEANYTPNDLERWLISCWRKEWPGDKGDRPTLKELQERIGRVRAVPMERKPEDYLRGLPEHLTRLPDENEPAEEDLAPPWPPPEWNVPGRIKDKWLATRDQLRVQLNASTFETWLRPTQPVHYVGDLNGGTLFLTVPNQYVQDWLDRYLLESMTHSFDSILNYGKAGAFTIKVILDGDLIEPENSGGS